MILRRCLHLYPAHLQALPTRANLFSRNAWLMSHSNKKPARKGSVWEELNIELMKDELQVSDIDKTSSIEVNGRLFSEKQKLIRTLEQFQTYLKSNKETVKTDLAHFQLTAENLSLQIEDICRKINEQACEPQNGYDFILYYKSINEFLEDTAKHPHLTHLAYIMEAFIKIKYLLQVSKVDQQQNMLNSSPYLFQDVWKRIKVIKFDEKKLNHDYLKLRKGLHTLVGIFQDFDIVGKNMMTSLAKLPFHLTHGILNHRNKILKSFRFFNSPNAHTVQFLNKMEKGILGKVLQLPMPKVRTNKMIYIPSRGDFQSNLNIFNPSEDTISVRVLYDKQLPPVSSDSPIEQAFVHMHGGGLILFSSFVTQNQTRFWAKEAKVLIFSIDYKLAPMNPFPEAVHDCLQVYRFLTEEIHKYFNIKLKKTFIGGDSAGGNLTCALTAMILKNKLLIPQSLFLIYPSLDLRKTIYYPSRQYTLIDPVLWPSLGLLVMKSYVRQESETQNPLVSPLLLTEEFVNGAVGDTAFPREWPNTTIIVGSKDPLRDQCLLFMERMTKSNVDCQCFLLQGWRHGFMNTEKYLGQSQIPFEMSLKIIEKMIQKGRLK